MIAEQDEDIQYNKFYYQRQNGEYLHSKRDGDKEVENLKKTMGHYAFSAQYQQNPMPVEGGIIKNNWLQYYNSKPGFNAIYQSWDCAIKAGKNNDYSVCTTWGILDNKYYLVDVFRSRLEYPALKKEIINKFNQYKPIAVIIEDKASGQQLIQELNNSGISIIKYTPKFDKVTRLILTSHLFESGRVLIYSNRLWVDDFICELSLFPNSDHDDQVDSMTQFLTWGENHHKKGKETLSIRQL
jgi:predicted phage terminase large subunit-like protein